MINWELFSPRNLFVVAILALIALTAFKHFQVKSSSAPVDTQ